MKSPKLVVAGTHNQFREWMRENKHPNQDYRYVHSLDAMQGIRDTEVIFIGSWYMRRDAILIVNEARAIGFRMNLGADE